MDVAHRTMIEILPSIGEDSHGYMDVPEVDATAMTCPASGIEASRSMTCPAAHMEESASPGITFCTNNIPGEFPSEYPEETDSTLLPCTICNRTFNPQALERHRKVCEKLSSKRRKAFNSIKQRVDGLDIPPAISTRGKSPDSKVQQAKTKSKWREKHQEFLRAIRAAKGMEDEEGGREGLPVSNVPSDYVQCPQCERHFGPKAADRHIEWCKEKATRMPRSPANTQAAERLKTRTKYAPPKPGQNGWRAPKKSDVISSIPPPSSGPTPTPGGALGAREFSPPANRQMSPTRSFSRQTSPPLPAGRHMSPPPMSPSRRTSISSVASLGRSGSMSLGRSAGKQLSSMLSSGHSSIYGSSPTYGSSSGYGQSSKYGQSSGYGQQSHYGGNSGGSLSRMQPGRSSFSGGVLPLVRQGSMRSSLRRTSPNTPMARHRDLASDMMASVCITTDPKRGEPEGDEAGDAYGACSSSLEAFSKLEDVTYDPFSAAELQMQSLMGLSKPSSRKGSGLGAAGLGIGISMMDSVRMEGTGRESPSFDLDIGLEEFEKEYQSTQASPGYGISKPRIRKDSESSGTGLSKLRDSLSGLVKDSAKGSLSSGRDADLDWPWKLDISSSTDRWGVGAVSPKLKKSSWSSQREARNNSNNQNLLSSISQENISSDSCRWSSAPESSRECRSWSSPSRDWLSLTHDIHNWSTSAQGNDPLSLPSHEIPRKSSPVRDVRYHSPDRSSQGWISPTRDSQSVTDNTSRFSSPSRDILNESSICNTFNNSFTSDAHNWPTSHQERHSSPHDSYKSFTHETHTRSSPLRDTRKEESTLDSQRLSSPSRDIFSRSSYTHDSYRISPSRNRESTFSNDGQKENSPTRESHRLSSTTQKPFGYDARSWSSPPRERLGDITSTKSYLPDGIEDKKESSLGIPSWKSAVDEKQKDICVTQGTSTEKPIQDRAFSSTFTNRPSLYDRRSASPVQDSNKWAASAQDEESSLNTASNSKSGWSIGETSSGHTSLSKYLGGSSAKSQGSSSLMSTTCDDGYKKKSGFETYRANRGDSVDGDLNSVKKATTNSANESQFRVSSGSSTDSSSLPPLSSPILPSAATGNLIGEGGSSTSAMNMPRFCHECGHKYPVLLAKFCCHCGSRRASVGN